MSFILLSISQSYDDLTAKPIFLAIFESVIFANGLSAPQHSTYFVIFEEGRERICDTPETAVSNKHV